MSTRDRRNARMEHSAADTMMARTWKRLAAHPTREHRVARRDALRSLSLILAQDDINPAVMHRATRREIISE